jgi:hypothetical protein
MGVIRFVRHLPILLPAPQSSAGRPLLATL